MTQPTHPTDQPQADEKPNDQNIASVDTSQVGAGNQSPRAPHERDEGVGEVAKQPDPVVEQGAKDLKRGLQDTSRADESDSAYQKQK